MDLNISSIGDQTNKRLLWQERKGLLKGVGEFSQLLSVHASVHHEEKSRRSHIWHTRKLVFASDILRNNLSRKIGFADGIGIMSREVIPSHTKRTDPKLGAEVDLAVRIKYSLASTSCTADWIVGQSSRWAASWIQLLERSVESAKRSNGTGSFQSRRRPAVEREPNSHHLLRRCHIPSTFLHLSVNVRRGGNKTVATSASVYDEIQLPMKTVIVERSKSPSNALLTEERVDRVRRFSVTQKWFKAFCFPRK
jgi:hypothetical protein